MSKIDRRKLVYGFIFISLFLSMLACRIEAPRIILEETPTLVPTQIITRVVTQVIIPTAAAGQPTQPPPPATEAPAATATWDPLAAPIYYPLPNCVASRLRINTWAQVSLVGGANAIRTSIDLNAETNIIYYAQPGETLYILDGPYCPQGYITWFVETKDGVRGFTPEGDGNEYWLWPTAP